MFKVQRPVKSIKHTQVIRMLYSPSSYRINCILEKIRNRQPCSVMIQKDKEKHTQSKNCIKMIELKKILYICN